MSDSFFIVIRSVGEATEQRLFNDLSQIDFIHEKNIAIVREKPFSESVKKTFELGIASNKKVLIVLDADLIIVKDRFIRFLRMVLRSPFQVGAQGFCHDFFWGGPRRGGVHCYNIETLKIYFEHLNFDPYHPRPETNVKSQLERYKGSEYCIIPYVCCFHGYLQAPADIARTLFIQSQKSSKYNSLILENFSDQNKLSLLINSAIKAGMNSNARVKIDVGDTPESLITFASKYQKIIDKFQIDNFSEGLLYSVTKGYKRRFSRFYFLCFSPLALHLYQIFRSVFVLKIITKLVSFQR